VFYKKALFKIGIVLLASSCNLEIPPPAIDNDNPKNSTGHSPNIGDTTSLLRIIVQYAEGYTPVSGGNNVVNKLTGVPDSVVNAFRSIRKISSPVAEEYLSLIFLKVYYSHLKCCHQSYELRTTIPGNGTIDSLSDPLLYEFNLITNYFDNSKRIEFIHSGMGHSWVEKNKRLLKNTKIRETFEKIKLISDSINKGIYWN